MNTIAKFIAPVALAFAAFGAQASQVTAGDIGFQPVVSGTASKMTSVVGAPSGERAFADTGVSTVRAATASVQRPDVMAEPLRTTRVIGA